MALSPGTRLGPYEILSSLGAGGMGEVYRARATKLGRDVALKVLPDEFATDPERVARFEREARVLASLNHPHIAQIYGFEAAADKHLLVMELVDGDDLAARIRRGPIPVRDTIAIAAQITQALDAAHAQSVIHRDLKPANVKVRGDGTVKLLDFGIAKAFAPAVPDAATVMDTAMTERGAVVGTAAYMSPEQARGQAIDKRTDIWAFGCVLYEMLTARRAFGGDTSTDVVAAVLTRRRCSRRMASGSPTRHGHRRTSFTRYSFSRFRRLELCIKSPGAMMVTIPSGRATDASCSTFRVRGAFPS